MRTFEELFTRDYESAKIGVFGCGCWFYWDQFEGLKEKITGYQKYFENNLRAKGINIISGGLAYYYRGLNDNTYERLGASLIVGSSILTGQGIPIAGELDIKNCVAMLIVDRLEAGGSFAEIHPCDFENDIVLVGHDGPHHIAVAEGRPVLRGLSLYHGKRGCGIGVEFQLKNGPITCVGLTQTYNGKFKFVVAEGESLPGPIPPTGNTNTRCRFSSDVGTFIENWSLEGPTHHFALGVEHIAHLIEEFCRCWGIECVNVTDPGYRRRQHIL